ncbi:MAG TPA: TonB-dependent receptor, partial [Solirubrobacteraceae bacterium]|nr:TonB-dependent receptor [Solirubrobacteraceae bacterium]
MPAAAVSLEGTERATETDSAGRYLLRNVLPGPQVLVVRRLGYAPTRLAIVAPTTGTLTVDLELAHSALRLQTVRVTADPTGRATGELGTATVIDQEAIRDQGATSLAGVLELLPGVPLQPPGLDGVEQIGLRALPNLGSSSGADLASFGTLIIVDGVPMSNNANLQSTGPRGEDNLATAAGGGIDLRQIPATALERVEVIRGIPSARYGDLTQGTIIVETRAGAFPTQVDARYDPRTTEASVDGGRDLGSRQALSITSDATQTESSPGASRAVVRRLTANLAHRLSAGGGDTVPGGFVLDSRAALYALRQDAPEQPLILPGAASWDHDAGLRLGEHLRARPAHGPRWEMWLAYDGQMQRSYLQRYHTRGALPLTERVTPGQSIGRFVGGQYLSQLSISGDPQLLYGRLEGSLGGTALALDHTLRFGTELRREWTGGAGYQFAIATPPQSSFNGINGFDRPRSFSEIPAVPTSGWYVDDRMLRVFHGGTSLEVQAGLRADVFHRGRWWLSKARDAVLEPRFNAQLAPRPWLRFRAGGGRMAKMPDVASLYPATEYYDVINVNWFTNDPAERLAVLTTFTRDPRNPRLGYSVANTGEGGVEVDLPRRAGTLGVTWFGERLTGGVTYAAQPSYLLRAQYQLSDSTTGTGVPPTIIEPPYRTDTIPILVGRPENALTMKNQGVEFTLSTREIPQLRTRIEVTGTALASRLDDPTLQFARGSLFS